LKKIPLLCPVRGCGRELERGTRAFVCARGHSFDVARSGYVNLLQPQDRRSAKPGDSLEAAAARRRLADAGHGEWLLKEVLGILDAVTPTDRLRGSAVLDLGCGEGSLLGSLSRRRDLDAHGLDLSAPAVDLAARRYPQPLWVVANADRKLPYPDAAFDLVISIDARRNGPEIARVLSPKGQALVTLPGTEDLIELREALLGRAVRRDRASGVAQALMPDLELVWRRTDRRSVSVDVAQVRDLLAATYRGGRKREAARVELIGPLQVTLHREILLLRRSQPGPQRRRRVASDAGM
jgi:23S rRNA (guanine745-N1)-methyltransferase